MMYLLQNRNALRPACTKVKHDNGALHYNNYYELSTSDPCKQSIYPSGYMPRCEVVIKQWTYNKTSGKCMEFGYHPCGEEREGYDVFNTELECMKTCLHKGISQPKFKI